LLAVVESGEDSPLADTLIPHEPGDFLVCFCPTELSFLAEAGSIADLVSDVYRVILSE
jgi:hypothetical protein